MPPRSRPPLGDGTETWHGTASGYNYHGCGCEACRRWMRRTKAAQALPSWQRAGYVGAIPPRGTLDSGIDPV